MKRSWLLILLLSLALVGCKHAPSTQPASSSSIKTVVTSKQYTTSELESRYTKLVDAVVKPLDMASYSKPAAKVKAAAIAQQTTVDDVRLQLVANTSRQQETKALVDLAKTAQTMLKTMTGTDQKAYNAAAKTFMSQTGTVAKQYFGGRVPQSLATYSKRMQQLAQSRQ
ncbi:hypothetical protein [Lacticaseibacillus jixiensis]|uniref:hypothetical protein n=1 Tax=Lacticaseibacillus jixiensis TaxID=3231926 RepID=UPI0036F34760